MPLALLPSPTKAAVAWTKAQTELAAIHGGRVGTRLNATLPAVRVQQVAGQVPDTWQGSPLIQWEFWASDEGTAELMGKKFIAALPTFRGVYDGGFVHTFGDVTDYPSADDPALSNNSRYIVTSRLLTTTI